MEKRRKGSSNGVTEAANGLSLIFILVEDDFAGQPLKIR
jgi:hypothetical protein